MTRDEFIGKVAPYAQRDMAVTGVLASVTIAQAILESQDGNSALASRYHNLFGIKGSYYGQSVNLRTREYTGTWINADFKVYPSWQESIDDHSKLLCTDQYGLSGEGDYKAACDRLQSAGYATSPTYASTLKSLISQHNLTRYDRKENLRTAPGNTADYADQIISIALAQEGIAENPPNSNRVKYNTWYYGAEVSGGSYPWCAVFVSWCANEAGISTGIIPKTAAVAGFRDFAVNCGRHHAPSGYSPQKGDIILFGTQHTGFVVSCDGTTVRTIEGNTSDRVAQRSYGVNDSRITGYFSPDYPVGSGAKQESAGGTTSSGQVYGKQVLKYIVDVADQKKKETSDAQPLKIKRTVLKQSKFSKCQLTVFHGKYLFTPVVEDGITWSLERRGAPGELSFRIKPDKVLKLEEGDAVQFLWNGDKVFYGFLFEKRETQDGFVAVTCYDQLRYLKNKDTYVYKKKRADQVIKMIAEDFGLKVGKLAKTSHVIPYKVEDDVTLFDIIENALDDTLVAETKMYVLFDQFGKLTLKNIKNMNVDIMIDAQTGQTYSYTSSINSDTYNKIKLSYSNDSTQTREIYIAKDSRHIRQWGVLQYYKKTDGSVSKTSDHGVSKALANKTKALIELYNTKNRRLQVNKCFGNVRVRAGSRVVVSLKLHDLEILSYMMVEKVKHHFEDVTHTMDITLVGGSFIA